MRLIHGGAEGASIHEHWSAIRDCPRLARAVTPSEQVAIAEIHERITPDELKRRQRIAKRHGVPFVENLPTRHFPQGDASRIAREQYAFLQRQLAVIGGTSTIKAAPIPRPTVGRSLNMAPNPPELIAIRRQQRFDAARELASYGMGKGALIARAFATYQQSL